MNASYVGPFVSKKERIAQEAKKDFTNIFVKNLPESYDEEQLGKIFGKYGTIKSAVIMKDDTSKSKGFAFINYDKPEEARAVWTWTYNFSPI